MTERWVLVINDSAAYEFSSEAEAQKYLAGWCIEQAKEGRYQGFADELEQMENDFDVCAAYFEKYDNESAVCLSLEQPEEI